MALDPEQIPPKESCVLINNLGIINDRCVRKYLQCRVRSRRGPPSRSRGGSWGRRSRLCRGCWAPACPPRWTPATQFKWSPVLRIRDFYPDSEFFPSRIRIFSIPDPNFFHPRSASKNVSILTPTNFSKHSEIWSGLFIPDPDHDFYPSQIPGSKRHRIPDPGSGTLVVTTRHYSHRGWRDANPLTGPSAIWARATFIMHWLHGSLKCIKRRAAASILLNRIQTLFWEYMADSPHP